MKAVFFVNQYLKQFVQISNNTYEKNLYFVADDW